MLKVENPHLFVPAKEGVTNLSSDIRNSNKSYLNFF